MNTDELAMLLMLLARVRAFVDAELQRRGKTEEEILDGALKTLGDEGAALKEFLAKL